MLRVKSSVPIDGAIFSYLARDGWRIECDTDLDLRRVAGALALNAGGLAWSALRLPTEALMVRHEV